MINTKEKRIISMCICGAIFICIECSFIWCSDKIHSLNKLNESLSNYIVIQQNYNQLLQKITNAQSQKIKSLTIENNTMKEEIYTLKSKKNVIQNTQQIIKNNKQKENKILLGDFSLSFYSKEQFPNTKTAIGVMPHTGVTVAVDPKIIPLGTKLYIEGFGERIAQDTGGAIKGNKLDVFVNTTQEALQLGRKTAKVWVIE